MNNAVTLLLHQPCIVVDLRLVRDLHQPVVKVFLEGFSGDTSYISYVGWQVVEETLHLFGSTIEDLCSVRLSNFLLHCPRNSILHNFSLSSNSLIS